MSQKIKILYGSETGWDGFCISKQALDRYNEILQLKNPNASRIMKADNFNRKDPILMQIFEEMGSSSGIHCDELDAKYAKYYSVWEDS